MQVRLSKTQKIKIANSEDVYAIMRAVLLRQNRLHQQKEYFWSMGLNTANDIVYLELVVLGSLNTVNVDPVELFSFAIQKKCRKIILIHNHPAGTLKPSKSDKELTKYLVKAAAFIKIQILDHLIISTEGYTSLADEGVITLPG